jgi:hypothetical protein
LPPIVAAVENATPGSFQEGEYGGFTRKKQAEE